MKAVLSSGIFWIVAMSAAWVAVAYWFLYKRGHGSVIMPGMGVLRDDKDVIIGKREVVVNLVFANSSDVDPSLLADMTVNVADILSGTYGVNGKAKPTKAAVQNNGITESGEEEPEEEDSDEYVDLGGEPELNTDLREEEKTVVQDVRKVSDPVDLKEFNL